MQFVLYSRTFEIMTGQNDVYKLEIDSDGAVYYYFRVTRTLPRIHKLHGHDKYVCSFIMQLWMTSTNGLVMKLKPNDIDLSVLTKYFINPQYEIQNNIDMLVYSFSKYFRYRCNNEKHKLIISVCGLRKSCWRENITTLKKLVNIFIFDKNLICMKNYSAKSKSKMNSQR